MTPNNNIFPGKYIPELFVPDHKSKELLNVVDNLEKLDIDSIDLQWVQVLAEGWAYPLKGFMRENELLQVTKINNLFYHYYTMIF